MKASRNYIVNGVEYMVLDGRQDPMPGRKGMALLAHRQAGAGADRVLVFTGTAREPSFRAYGADGSRSAARREDYLVLARYLRDCGLAPNAAELARHLGEEAILAAQSSFPAFELRMTEHFWQRLLALDACERKIA